MDSTSGCNRKAKQPYCFEVGDGEIFAFAGLWDRWIDAQGKQIESCSIITTIANSHLADIHDRMPVILPSGVYASWLNPAMGDPRAASRMAGAVCRGDETVSGGHEDQPRGE